MPKVSTPPAATEKIGKKIDYVMATHLVPALALHGFKRKARTAWREVGDGPTRALQVVNLQGFKWNEGSNGKFCINLGVQFPALTELMATRPGSEWLHDGAGKPDEPSCNLRTRIDGALPEQREAWWPEGLQRGHDHWFEIGPGTDLEVLGTKIARLVVEYGLALLEENSNPARLLTESYPGWWFSPGPLWRIAAGVLLGRHEEAKALREASRQQLAEMRDAANADAWLASIGLDSASA
jgi:Domain of unknown function (DUF4304)